MNARDLLKQAVRQVCEEAGEPWEEPYEEDFDDTTISKTAEVFATLVLAEHAAELDALRAENARLRAELEAVGAGGVQPLRAEGGPPGSGGWMLYAQEMMRERDCFRRQFQIIQDHKQGEVWYWQGDGGDHLESMANSLPVVIRADQLRALLAGSKAPQQPASVPPQKPTLRVGQIWRTRGGDVVEIKSETENSPYPFVCGFPGQARCKLTVTKNGTCYESAQHPSDLFELISDVPQKGGVA